jgi:hypothetical protein
MIAIDLSNNSITSVASDGSICNMSLTASGLVMTNISASG